MKFKITILIICLVITFIGCSDSSVDETIELISNGEFTEWSGETPLGWMKNIWSEFQPKADIEKGTGKTPLNDDPDNNYVILNNASDADTRIVFVAQVEPNTVYRLSALVKIILPPVSGRGASLAVMDVNENFPDIKSTNDQWQEISLYGKTGPNQNTLTAAVRLGGYAALTKGKAAFDHFSLRAQKAAPANTRIWQFYIDQSEIEAARRVEEAKKQKTIDEVSTHPIPGTILYSAIFLVIFGLCYFFLFKNKKLDLSFDSKKILIIVLIILVAAFGLRVIIGYNIEGQSGDLSCFKGWGDHAYSVPWSDYYGYWSAYQDEARENGDYWCDYPPVYVMILSLLSAIRHIFGWAYGSAAYTLLIKLPNIISDVIISCLIFVIAQKKLKHNGLAIGLTLLYALNPAIIINSAIWGQADAIYTLLALLIIHFVIKDKFWLSGLILGVAILIKIQTAFVAFAMLYSLIAKKSLKTWILTVVSGIGIFILAILPFGIKLPPEWIVVQLLGTLMGYPYASVNAYNFFAILGGNWKGTGTPFILPFPELNAFLISLAGFFGLYAWGLFKNYKKGLSKAFKKANKRLIPLIIIWGSFFLFFAIASPALRRFLMTSFQFTLPYLSWDWIGIILGTLLLAYSIIIFVKAEKKDVSKNYYISLLLITGIFMVIPGMHERYLYAAILFSLMTYIYSKDRRFIVLFLASSFSVLLNVFHVYDIFHVADNLPRFPDYPLRWDHPVMFFNGLFNCFMFAYMLWAGFDLYIKHRAVEFLAPPKPEEIDDENNLDNHEVTMDIDQLNTLSPGSTVESDESTIKNKKSKPDGDNDFQLEEISEEEFNRDKQSSLQDDDSDEVTMNLDELKNLDSDQDKE